MFRGTENSKYPNPFLFEHRFFGQARIVHKLKDSGNVFWLGGWWRLESFSGALDLFFSELPVCMNDRAVCCATDFLETERSRWTGPDLQQLHHHDEDSAPGPVWEPVRYLLQALVVCCSEFWNFRHPRVRGQTMAMEVL
jgi:hypothetical protein